MYFGVWVLLFFFSFLPDSCEGGWDRGSVGVIWLFAGLGVFPVSGCPVPSPPLRGIGGDLAAELAGHRGFLKETPLRRAPACLLMWERYIRLIQV